MLRMKQVDFLHVAFSVKPLEQGKAKESARLEGHDVSSKPPSIRNYSQLTFLILQNFPRFAQLFGFKDKKDIIKYEYIVENQKGKETLYLDAKEAQTFINNLVRPDFSADQINQNHLDEASEKPFEDTFSCWLNNWQQVAKKTHEAASPILNNSHLNSSQASIKGEVESVLSSFTGAEEEITQLTAYLTNKELPRDEKLLQVCQNGNVAAIKWLAGKEVDGEKFNFSEFVTASAASGEVPIQENPLLIAMRRTDPEGREVALFLIEHMKKNNNGKAFALQQQGRALTSYSIEGYEKFQRLIDGKGLVPVREPCFKHGKNGLDEVGSVAASIYQMAENMDMKLNQAPEVHLMESAGHKPSIQIQFKEEQDQAAAENLMVRFAGANLVSWNDYDSVNRQLTIPADQAEKFLEKYCKLPPQLISDSFTEGKGDAAQYAMLHSTLRSYAPDFKVILSPSGRPQVQFKVGSQQVATELQNKIAAVVRATMWREYNTKVIQKSRGEKVRPWQEPLLQGFQIQELQPAGSGFTVTLTSNESYHLLGFGKVSASVNKEEVKQKEAEFRNFMARLGVTDVVTSTPAIDKRYTSITSMEDQRIAHDAAKTLLGKLISTLGGVVSFFRPPPKGPKHPVTELKDVKPLPIEGGEALDSDVFSREDTKGVEYDIQRDGNREEDNIVVYGVASQFNSCEAPRRCTIEPGRAVEVYKGDPTQGPRAQLQFDSVQVEAINAMGNRGMNAICRVLDESTKNAIAHGYLTPSTLGMLNKIIQQFRDNGDKMEITCVANVPTKGTKRVHQFLTSAPAFGQYRLANLPKELEKELEFICALHTFRAQFEELVRMAKEEEGKPVIFKPAAIGLGAFGNHPEAIAKAFYKAAKEYEGELKTNNVKVKFQVFGVGGDGHVMATSLGLKVGVE